MNFKNLKNIIYRTTGKSSLLLKKHSPEILTVAGIGFGIAGAVFACKATLKVDDILEESKDELKKVNSVKEKVDNGDLNEELYSNDDYMKDRAIIAVKTSVKIFKTYAPAISLGVVSVGCILSAHNIMKKRNLALMAAYKAVEMSFADYRERVVEEFGEEKDRLFRYGLKENVVKATQVDENGKEKKVNVVDPNHYSQYARFFDEASSQWSNIPEYNLTFLKAQQNYANDLLHSRGHVFLNEIYDMLGIPRSQAGAVVGWVLSEEGDGFIDFGIFEAKNEKARDFVNGYEDSILLDFNVDGVIYDLI